MKKKCLCHICYAKHLIVLPSQINKLLTERDFCCSAKPFKIVSPYLVAELEIYCLEKDQEKILSEIQRLIKQDGLFEASYLTPNYPRKEIKFLITWFCFKNLCVRHIESIFYETLPFYYYGCEKCDRKLLFLLNQTFYDVTLA